MIGMLIHGPLSAIHNKDTKKTAYSGGTFTLSANMSVVAWLARY